MAPKKAHAVPAEGQETLGAMFDVPPAEQPAVREYHFPSAIPEDQLAQRAAESQVHKRSLAEREALNAIAAENRNLAFIEVGSMKGGDIRGDMLSRPTYAAQGPTEAEAALDVFLKGSSEETPYIVRNIKLHFADSIGIAAKAVKESDEPGARMIKVEAEDPEQQAKLDKKFAQFFVRYAGTRNRDALVARRKQLTKIIES